MKAIRNFWESIIFSILKPSHPLPPGSFHYQSTGNGDEPYRLHLRINPDGQGLLIVNASTVLHLNQTAAEYAYYIVNQVPKPQAAQKVAKRYQVSTDQALEDITHIEERIQSIIHEQDLDPVTFLDFDEVDPYSTDLTAPLRLDCALTYQYNGTETRGLAPQDRVKQELTTEQWHTILDKAWSAGIPHVIFTGGEPTLRSDLGDLILHSEKLGMVTGLLTNGIRLMQPDVFEQFLQAGLDHIMLLLEPGSEESWQVIEKVEAEDIFLTVHLTISPSISESATLVLSRLAGLGVTHISLSAVGANLAADLQAARQAAAELGLTLVADLPVPYSKFNPVTLEIAGAAPHARGAGSKWLYVEPDGDVLPAQGDLTLMGNLLSDPWEEIWAKKPAA